MPDVQKEPFQPGLSKDKELVALLEEFETNPRSRSFVALAERFRSHGLFQQAIEILEEGMNHHPQLAAAEVVLGRCWMDQRKYADALQLMQQVLRRNPENIKAERLRAEIFMRLGQKQAAIGALTRVLGLMPQDDWSRKCLEELNNIDFSETLSRSAPAEAVESPTVEAKIKPGRLSDFIESAGALPPSAEKNEALVLAEVPAKQEFSRDTDESDLGPAFATRTVAELYLRQGLNNKAKLVLEAILERDPEDQWAKDCLRKIEPSGANSKGIQARRIKLMLQAQSLERLLGKVRKVRQDQAAQEVDYV